MFILPPLGHYHLGRWHRPPPPQSPSMPIYSALYPRRLLAELGLHAALIARLDNLSEFDSKYTKSRNLGVWFMCEGKFWGSCQLGGQFLFVSFSAMLSMSAFSTGASSLLPTSEQVTLTALVLNLYNLRDFELMVRYS